MGTPRYPKDMASEWSQLKKDVKAVFTSANKRVGMAKIGAKVIEITGELMINAGASLVAKFRNGVDAFRVGQFSYAGKSVEGVLLRRADASLIFWAWGDSDTGDGFWGMYDKNGTLVMGDDGISGVGLARPWIPYTTFRTADLTTPYMRNTSTTYQVQHTIMGYAQHPKLVLYIFCHCPSGDTGQYRITDTDDGTVLYESANNLTGTNWQVVIFDVRNYSFGKLIRYDIEARRVSGTGAGVGVTPTLVYGRQT